VNVLVDTPVWSAALRRSTTHLSVQQQRVCKSLQELISESRAELLGPVRQELLSGIREPSQFARLRKTLRAFPDVLLNAEDFEEAARMSNACRAKGVAGSGVDYLICAVAARRNFAIFTLDDDFDRYAKYLPITIFKTSSRT
jgi:predicted nucleic acid-binding protein